MPQPPHLLIITTTARTGAELQAMLSGRYPCTLATPGALAALPEQLAQDKASLLITEGVSAERIGALAKECPGLLLVPLVPENNRLMARQMLAAGAFAVLLLPLDQEEVRQTLLRASQHLQLESARQPPAATRQPDSLHGMIGASPQMHRLFALIARIAEDDIATVLIRGESGTGKEMVARAIHASSPRASRNFVPVNCAAIPDDLLESELFGYSKGAFTGATTSKQGRIQYADGGTLFLDEIGDMKFPLQAKLLRVLQEKEFEPVGALKPVPVDTRILAATHCDLEQLVREGRFREDLYYRLSVIPVHIPSLRERREDIPLLIESFIDNFTSRRNRAPFRFAPQVQAALCQCEWRGNVRELENLIQYMSVLYSGQEVGFADLPEKFQDVHTLIQIPLQSPSPSTPSPAATTAAISPDAEGAFSFRMEACCWERDEVDFNALISDFESRLILHALQLTAGNKKEAARILKLKRTTLLEKMKKKDLLFAGTGADEPA